MGSKLVSLDFESSSVCITDVLDNTYRDLIVQRFTCSCHLWLEKGSKKSLKLLEDLQNARVYVCSEGKRLQACGILHQLTVILQTNERGRKVNVRSMYPLLEVVFVLPVYAQPCFQD